MKTCLASLLVWSVHGADPLKSYEKHENKRCQGDALKTWGGKNSGYASEIEDEADCALLCANHKECKGFSAQKSPKKCSFWMETMSGQKDDASEDCYVKKVDGYDVKVGHKCAGGDLLVTWKKDDCETDDADSNYNSFLEEPAADADSTTFDDEELERCRKRCDEHKECSGFNAIKVKKADNTFTKCSFWLSGDVTGGAAKSDTSCYIKTDADKKCKKDGKNEGGGDKPAGGGDPSGEEEPAPEGEEGPGHWVDVTLNVPIPCPTTVKKEVRERRSIDVPVPVPVTRCQDVPCPVPTPVQVPVPVTQTVHVRVPVPNIVERRVPTPVTVQVQVPNPVPTPVPNPIPCPVPQTIQQRVPVPVYVDRVVDVPVPVPVPVQAPQPVVMPAPTCGVVASAAPAVSLPADFGAANLQVAGPAMPSL